MDELYGIHTSDHVYSDKPFMSSENLIFPAEYNHYNYCPNSFISSGDNRQPIPVLASEGLGIFDQSSGFSESTSINFPNPNRREIDDEQAAAASSVIKARIASHPSYPRLLDAYIDCQKVGAPPEIATLLDEIRREKDLYKQIAVSTCFGDDPELDEFMETYCDVLRKYKSDLSRPFDEATSFLNTIETQLCNLSIDDGSCISPDDEEVSEWGTEDAQPARRGTEECELKDRLLQRYGTHISSLKQEFSKKKKKGKLPNEARLALHDWWSHHSKWPYPTEADKVLLAESTGLDQKQINNWFINQRKRHWKPSENMQLAIMENLSGHFFAGN